MTAGVLTTALPDFARVRNSWALFISISQSAEDGNDQADIQEPWKPSQDLRTTPLRQLFAGTVRWITA